MYFSKRSPSQNAQIETPAAQFYLYHMNIMRKMAEIIIDQETMGRKKLKTLQKALEVKT